MLKQTLVWTALPKGSDGPLAAGTQLHFSVFVAPRLWNSDPNVQLMKLQDFPDFLDWPAVVGGAAFQVEFDGGPTLNATPENVDVRSNLWQALFKNETKVIPFTFEDLTGVQILSFPAATIEETLKGVYQQAAIDDSYGSGVDLPKNVTLAADLSLRDIARPTEPEEPYKPVEPDRGPVRIDEGRPPDEEDKRDKAGCWGCLIWPLAVVRLILKWLGLLGQIFPMAPPEDGPGSQPEAISSAQATAFNQLQTYLQPTDLVTHALPTAQELEAEYDFHKMVSLLGDYPKLLGYMGLVVDLVVTLDVNLPAAPGKVRVLPTLALQNTTTHYTPWTHYELADNRFLARHRPSDPDQSNGFLRLNDANKFRVTQVDLAGGGTKLQNMATTIVALTDRAEWPANSPDESGLPALQTAGISIVRPEKSAQLAQTFYRSYALNLALAAVDGSPSAPPLGSAPPPPADDELWAEDVTRGYRIDVWDDQATAWRSLCQRLGTYTFLEAPGGVETLQDEEDEGFVQMSATEPLQESGGRTLRAHEMLVTWDGWSLSAPRPGQTIMPDHSIGDPANTAVTDFKLETSFRVKPSTLPRLRFGTSYRLRARVVDLAGNSVFDPDDVGFNADPVETTVAFEFRRFDPVSPPALVFREEPKEGESLERLTVRSKFDDAPAAITSQATERHIVPPKASQLMAERHGHFDGSPEMLKGQAGYDLASREAGSLTHRLNLGAGTLDLIDGIQEITTPERTIWLQTKAQFELAYLPDPYARGVLLLGLPGMAAFEQIIEPNGQIVNKIPFEGTWPDRKPLRLRLEGLPAGAAPAQPSWDGTNRLLTVGLAQGETVQVRISSYFHEADLRNMGVWEWTEVAGPPNLVDLRKRAVAGRNWLYLPFRTLVLVHAVQQPLKIPAISHLELDPDKVLGETTASLKPTFELDGKSTGKVDLYAAWTDPFDDPAKPAFDSTTDLVSQEMHVAELVLEEGSGDQVTVENVVHALGDTKYHQVTYWPVATTRFREYFPPSVTANPQNLVRPAPGESLVPTTLDVPNSARPDAPKPLYSLPTFAWDRQESGGVITKNRRGGGLRVYMERPWYSSGDGELLGVLVRPDEIQPLTELAETMKKYTSEWGMDPIWPAQATAPLKLSDLLHADDGGHHLSLAELPASVTPGAAVHVAGYLPEYDSDRNLWYADIPLDLREAYYPFVRLALARFQPVSVTDAHLSRVALADFVQVAPNRRVTYDLNNLSANDEVVVTLRGPSYFFAGQHASRAAPIAVARVEQRQYPGLSDELGWVPVTTTLMNRVSDATADMVWEAIVHVPATRPLRLLVLEAELYLTDGRPVDDIVGLLKQETVPVPGATAVLDLDKRTGYRVTFADAIELT